MLNEALHDALIKLGIDNIQAIKAASEDDKFQQLVDDVGDIRLTMSQLLCQAAQINDRLINTDALLKVIISRIGTLEKSHNIISNAQEKSDQQLIRIESILQTMVRQSID